LIFHLAINEDLNTSHQNTCEALVLTCRDTEIHLAARCAGLLELGSLNSGSAIKAKAPYLDCCVQWLHRTVREYLEDEKCSSYLLTHKSKVNFNPSISLMSAYILMASFRVHIDSSDLFAIANCAMIYGYWATSYITTLQPRSTALHSTYRLMNSRLTSDWAYLLLGKRGYSFPVLATTFGLTDYIRFCRLLPSSLQVTCLLEELLEPNWMTCAHIALPAVRVEMLSLLLRLGARLHEQCRRILHNIVNEYATSEPDGIAELSHAMEAASRGMKRNVALMEEQDLDEEANKRRTICRRTRMQGLGSAESM
jgi:hypothetical protein